MPTATARSFTAYPTTSPEGILIPGVGVFIAPFVSAGVTLFIEWTNERLEWLDDVKQWFNDL